MSDLLGNEPEKRTDEMSGGYNEALTEAAGSAARLGMALALFQNDLDKLSQLTPKCACGWARGRHAGACKHPARSGVEVRNSPAVGAVGETP